MDNKAKEGAPQIEIREFTDLRDVRPFASDRRYDGLPLRAILGIVRQKGLQKVGVDIADCDGVPAGCVAFQWDYRGDSRSCYLFALFVKPEFRRKGVAERLVKSFCDNYRKVVLGVESGNEPAVKLYKKLGFEFTGKNEPVKGKDIKVMERTKKFSILFDKNTRTFGLLADRVRRTAGEHLRGKAIKSGSNSDVQRMDEFNKRSQYIEDSGRTAPTSLRTLRNLLLDKTSRKRGTQYAKYKGDVRRAAGMGLPGDEDFYKAIDKNNENANIRVLDELDKIKAQRNKGQKANDAFIQNRIVEAMEKSGTPVTKGNEYYESDKSGVHIDDVNPVASDAAHEWQHWRNRWDENLYDQAKRKMLRLKDKKDRGEGVEFVMSNPENIFNYANNVQLEEMSANRGGVVNQFVHGGRFVDKDHLQRGHERGELNQQAYDALVSGYRPPNLNWEMDDSAIRRMREQQKKLRR